MSQKVVQIGCGKMGEMWAKSFYNNGADIDSIIDPSPRDENFARTVDSEFYSSITDCSTSYDADIWCIAAPTEKHLEYLKNGIRKEIPKIFVEKPVTREPDKAEKLLHLLEGKDTNVYVDYIETQHPSVRMVLDDLDEDFILTQAIHWRGKESPEVLPHLRDDLCNDLSEIMKIYEETDRNFSEISLYRIGEMYNWDETERNIDSVFSEIYDAGSSIHLEGDMGEPILLKGGYNEKDERRYFCWVDDVNHQAYFVSTLIREELSIDDILKSSEEKEERNNKKMSTFAIKVEGTTNTDKLVHNAIEGTLTNMEDFKELFEDIEATRIVSEDVNSEEPDKRISEKIMMGETCPVSLEEAVEIEKKIKEIYDSSDEFEDMYEEERKKI